MNPVELTELNPVTEVTVPPNDIIVEPNVVVLFANLLFAIAVPLQIPVVIVPTVAKLDNEVNDVFSVAVIFPAVVAVVALPVTLPVKLPVNPAAVIEPLVFMAVTLELPNWILLLAFTIAP